MKQADQNINTKQMTDDEAEEVFFALMAANQTEHAIDFMLGHLQNAGVVRELPDGSWELTSRGWEEARHRVAKVDKFVQKHRGNLRKAYLNQRLGKKKGA